MQRGLGASISVFSIILSSSATGQVLYRYNTEFGELEIRAEVVKTTFIGAYERYLKGIDVSNIDPNNPFKVRASNASLGQLTETVASSKAAVSDEPRRSGRRLNFLEILLPTGKVPDDLAYNARFVPGVSLSAAMRPDFLKFWNGVNPQLSFGVTYDENTVRVKAPTGFGILIDPTSGVASAKYIAMTAEASVPIAKIDFGQYNLMTSIGHGWMLSHKVTTARVFSDFLDLKEVDRRFDFDPLFSIQFDLAKRPEGTGFEGMRVRAFAVKTDLFWTAGISSSLNWKVHWF